MTPTKEQVMAAWEEYFDAVRARNTAEAVLNERINERNRLQAEADEAWAEHQRWTRKADEARIKLEETIL